MEGLFSFFPDWWKQRKAVRKEEQYVYLILRWTVPLTFANSYKLLKMAFLCFHTSTGTLSTWGVSRGLKTTSSVKSWREMWLFHYWSAAFIQTFDCVCLTTVKVLYPSSMGLYPVQRHKFPGKKRKFCVFNVVVTYIIRVFLSVFYVPVQ